MHNRNSRMLFGSTIILLSLLFGGKYLVDVAYAAPLAQDTATQDAEQDADTEIPHEPGVLISSVLPNGPAAAAGVKRGNILLKVNDSEVNTTRALRTALQDLKPDTEVTLTVLHGDDERTLTVTLGDDDGEAWLGIVTCGDGAHIVDLLAEPHEGFEFRFPGAPQLDRLIPNFGSDGARIVEVVPDGPAAAAGVSEGDIVEAVDGTPVDAENTLAALIQSYKPGDTVTLDIRRVGETIVLTDPDLDSEDADREDVQEEDAASEDADSEDADSEDADSEDNDGTDSDEADSNEEDEAAEDEGADHEDTDVTRELEKQSVDELFVIEAEIAQVEVTLAAHPDDAEQAYLGVSYGPVLPMGSFGGDFVLPNMPFDREDMPRFTLPNEMMAQGAVIMRVEEDSPAAAAGLTADDLITAIDGEPIDGPRALVDVIDQRKPGDEIALSIEPADGNAYDVVITLGENDEGNAYLGIQIGAFFRREFRKDGDFNKDRDGQQGFFWRHGGNGHGGSGHSEGIHRGWGFFNGDRAARRTIILSLLSDIIGESAALYEWFQNGEHDGRMMPRIFRFFEDDNLAPREFTRPAQTL